ncbi:MAG: hypothetical protein KatS3mg024_2109 [Armatimonadota bacterium]|nr:MAG: hypothetical protein KatS3mg024_2109 [Armatimonadota bacterium]
MGGYLIRPDNTPARARFPVVDLHNHLWARWESLDGVVQIMDETGVAAYCDLTANLTVEWGGGGYILRQGDIGEFFRSTSRFPGRFLGFTAATFGQAREEPLFQDASEFVERTIRILRDHVERGARGLKILKELGLIWRDASGRLVSPDDPRLFEIWEEAGRLGVPVLIHQADPIGFFDPVTPENEHYDSLQKYPDWSFCDRQRFPSHAELLEHLENLIASHRTTTFLLPHGANWPENLEWLDGLLQRHPNVYLDFSARLDELGRQPYSAREFHIRHQDRIYFGTDMPASPELYRFHWRFYETFDEHLTPPDYDGTFGRHRWKVCGIGLPDDVLRKLYYGNALKIVPGLREQLEGKVG